MPYPLFIDLEASALEGFPIEVGWCDREGQTEAHLIRPAHGWTLWDPAAERIHKLSRATLIEQGEPVEAVASRVQAAAHGKLLFSDNPNYDTLWLSMLFSAAGLDPALLVHHVSHAWNHASERLPDWRAAQVIREAVEQHKGLHEHRAGPDARRLWCIWRTVVESP